MSDVNVVVMEWIAWTEKDETPLFPLENLRVQQWFEDGYNTEIPNSVNDTGNNTRNPNIILNLSIK